MRDVIVVGAGAAGLTAALAAARSGARVLLLERSDGETSSLAMSGGLIAAAGTRAQEEAGITDSVEAWRQDILGATAGTADATVTRLVTLHAARALDLVAEAVGAPPSLVGDITFPGHSAPRLHEIAGRDGRGLQRALARALPAIARIERRDGVSVQSLLSRDGRVGGVTARAGGVEAAFPAAAVVLASGGYGANPEIVGREIAALARASYIGSAESDGRALAWAVALGAALRDMGGYQGHGHATVVGNGRLGAGPTTVGALLVNLAGRRFVDESLGPSGLAGHVARQPRGIAIEIYGEKMHQSFLRFGPYRHTVEAGAVRRFDTLPDLAALHEVDLARLRRTLDDFNSAATGREPDAFGRTDFGGPIAPPFWAVAVKAALVHTQGGLVVDERARVAGNSGTAIPGLFAAGGCAVGMSGNDPAGYLPGNGLSQSITLGMLAGEHAAAAATAKNSSSAGGRSRRRQRSR